MLTKYKTLSIASCLLSHSVWANIVIANQSGNELQDCHFNLASQEDGSVSTRSVDIFPPNQEIQLEEVNLFTSDSFAWIELDCFDSDYVNHKVRIDRAASFFQLHTGLTVYPWLGMKTLIRIVGASDECIEEDVAVTFHFQLFYAAFDGEKWLHAVVPAMF